MNAIGFFNFFNPYFLPSVNKQWVLLAKWVFDT